MTPTAPFYRNGQPVPLTCADYAARSGMTSPAAAGALRVLVRSGKVRQVFSRGGEVEYEIAPQQDEPAKPAVALAFEPDAQLAAVAKRAFGGPVDVRPLLPLFEAQIGQMMRRSVPVELRPATHNNGGNKPAQALRQDRLSRTAELVGFGLTCRQIANVMGVTLGVAEGYVRAVKVAA